MPMEKPVDLTTVAFRDDGFLSMRPLNASTAVEYLACSQFYDRTCNNELLKMQQISDVSKLASMTGIEYTPTPVYKDEPHLFVLRKQLRESPDRVKVLATYYILYGTIYQAPSVHALFTSRVVKSVHALREAFNEVASHVIVTPEHPQNHTWDFAPVPTSSHRRRLNAIDRTEHILRSAEQAYHDKVKKEEVGGNEKSDGSTANSGDSKSLENKRDISEVSKVPEKGKKPRN